MTDLEALTAFFACALGEIADVRHEAADSTREPQRTLQGTHEDRPAHPELEPGPAVRQIPEDDLGVTLPPAAVRPAIARLVARCGISHLTTITAVDVGESVQLKYHFWHSHGLTLETSLPADSLTISTVTDIIPGAAFYEREIHGMFGVDFGGHADLRPLLLPDAWQGDPPLRKGDHDG